jgi:hypothetical protein
MTKQNRSKMATVWATVATVLSIFLGAKTITGLPSCSDYAMAADVKQLETMLQTNAIHIGELTVHMTHMAKQIERIDERSRLCE